MIKLSKLPVFDFFSLLKPVPPPRRELKARRVVQISQFPAPLRYKTSQGNPDAVFMPANIERARRERRL